MELEKYPRTLDPPIGPQPAKVDVAKVRQEADELYALAQTIPADVAQVEQGKLPKEIGEKLKRIEKIAKHLRGELAP